MRNTLLAAISISALTLSSSQPLVAQSDNQQLGNVHFDTSCNEVAQRRFDRAMRYQHSFWYTAAQELYEETAKADPECGIAYWGVALSLLSNPHGAIPAPNLAPGLAAIKKAKAIGAKTERERDFIDALTLMYVDYDKVPQSQRIRSYLGAMEKLATKYPNDDEAQIHYAPRENLESVDAREIGRARLSIDMAAYVLSDPQVIEALINAAERGVVIRLYFDKSQFAEHGPARGGLIEALLAHPNVAARVKGEGVLMHLKAYAIDGEVLRTGSGNFSRSGLAAQDNDLIFITDLATVDAFENNFERIWARARNLEALDMAR